MRTGAVLIELANGSSPDTFDVTLTIGGLSLPQGPCPKSELRREIEAFADGLLKRQPFGPEIGFEPIANVVFSGDTFVAYYFRPRFKRGPLRRVFQQFTGIKVGSQPESVEDAVAYLRDFATRLPD